jgi:hypothetical protein
MPSFGKILGGQSSKERKRLEALRASGLANQRRQFTVASVASVQRAHSVDSPLSEVSVNATSPVQKELTEPHVLEEAPKLILPEEETEALENEVVNEKRQPHAAQEDRLTSIFEDWSGRGAHVDFGPNEKLPIEEGRCLGKGVNGLVYEARVQGIFFAWKRRWYRGRISQIERKEIEIMKKLSHPHIIRLIGTYTHRQILGMLLYPVAVCDLQTFFQDLEVSISEKEIDAAQKDRLEKLGLPHESKEDLRRSANIFLYTSIGCIISAVAYLHSENIRHKDLKPANILLAQDHVWLADFGSATDFSLLSQSATDNGRSGTARYLAPEAALGKPSGRPADIFALGCVLLEICVISCEGSLRRLDAVRSAQDGSYQANLGSRGKWFDLFQSVT